MKKTIKIAVSGIPRGYHFPRPDGNWLQKKHKEQILAVSPGIELVEIPAHEVNEIQDIQVLLAEGGNRVHYPGELPVASRLLRRQAVLPDRVRCL